MGSRRWIGFGLFVFPALIVLSGLLAAAPKVEKLTPAEAISGVWRGDISDTQAFILSFERDVVDWKLENKGELLPIYRGKLSFPKEHADRHLDWTELKMGGQPAPDNLCLYRLTGDTLLIIGGGGKDRPTRFYTGPGGEPRTLVFTRVKEAKSK